MLSKWVVPGFMFAGWMVWPAIDMGSGGDSAAPKAQSTFNYEKEDVGETPTLA